MYYVNSTKYDTFYDHNILGYNSYHVPNSYNKCMSTRSLFLFKKIGISGNQYMLK